MAPSPPADAAAGAADEHPTRTDAHRDHPALDLDRLEAILERQVEEVAYASTLAALDGVLPDTLRRFVT